MFKANINISTYILRIMQFLLLGNPVNPTSLTPNMPPLSQDNVLPTTHALSMFGSRSLISSAITSSTLTTFDESKPQRNKVELNIRNAKHNKSMERAAMLLYTFICVEHVRLAYS